jgi:predicted kinase
VETRTYYLIVRGPLGVGKSAVSRRVARKIGGVHISIDRILDDRHLWYSGRLSEFLAANSFAVREAAPHLASGRPVVFDGNFYWKRQIEDLVGHLESPHFVFTLDAPLSVCIERDGGRDPPHGAAAARQVYRKTTAFEYGEKIDASGPLETVVAEILSRLPPARSPARQGPQRAAHR